MSASAEARSLAAAEKIVELLAQAGVPSALIGAIALAAHQYASRSTEDVDLAVGIDPRRLGDLSLDLRRAGSTAEVSAPDDVDPLGGVLRVGTEDGERIEIVNFCNPPGGGFPALIEAALREATPYRPDTPLRVVTLQHLVLFKLYAGGMKSKNDVLELLSRNPELDMNELRAACRRFHLDRRLSAWVRELTSPDEG